MSKKSSVYKLPLKGIAQGSFQYDYILDDTFFANREGFDISGGEIKITLTGERINDVFNIEAHVRGFTNTLCSRCEGPLLYPLDTNYHAVIKLGSEASDDCDEEIVVSRDNPTLDLEELFYSYVVLSIPMHRTHPVGECLPDVEHYFDSQEVNKSTTSVFAQLLENVDLSTDEK